MQTRVLSVWPVQNRRVTGQEREAEAWQSMEGFDQKSHSENHKLMEEREGVSIQETQLRLEMGRNQSLRLIQWAGKAARNGDGTRSEE